VLQLLSRPQRVVGSEQTLCDKVPGSQVGGDDAVDQLERRMLRQPGQWRHAAAWLRSSESLRGAIYGHGHKSFGERLM
jgi:hypothetical protein